MTPQAQVVEFHRPMEQIEAGRPAPVKGEMATHERMCIKHCCHLCGRARPASCKFEICRCCLQKLVGAGFITGVQTALTAVPAIVLLTMVFQSSCSM